MTTENNMTGFFEMLTTQAEESAKKEAQAEYEMWEAARDAGGMINVVPAWL